MWSGTTSVGSSTIGSGKMGKSSSWPPAMRSVYLPRLGGQTGIGPTGRPSRSAGLSGGEQQVVEETRRQAWLEKLVVEPLERDVAPVGELKPRARNAAGVGVSLERAKHPPVGAGKKLLAHD